VSTKITQLVLSGDQDSIKGEQEGSVIDVHSCRHQVDEILEDWGDLAIWLQIINETVGLILIAIEGDRRWILHVERLTIEDFHCCGCRFTYASWSCYHDTFLGRLLIFCEVIATKAIRAT
jgi:hypothetical protein